MKHCFSPVFDILLQYIPLALFPEFPNFLLNAKRSSDVHVYNLDAARFKKLDDSFRRLQLFILAE